MRLYSSAFTLVASCFLQHARVILGDNVLVMSSTNALVHDTSAAVSTFSVTGLTQFAMESFGLSTSRVVKLSNVEDISSDLKNPIQADVFKKNTAYAVVVVEGEDYVLEALETSSAVSNAGFHKVFPLSSSESVSYDVLSSVLVNEVASQFEGDATVECAGNADLCASYASEEVDSDGVNSLLKTLGFLDAQEPADVAFASEIFQVKQLTKALEDGVVTNARALYIVNFASISSLDESKKAAANVVVSAQATEFLQAYLSRFGDKNCGAQVIATKQAVGMEKVGEIMSLSRLLEAVDGSSGGSAETEVGSSSGSTGDEVVDKVVGGDTKNGTDSNGFSNKPDFGMTEIAEYQIVLWTSVILAVVLTMAILAMCNMNVGRDNLLYAKFIADGGHRKAD